MNTLVNRFVNNGSGATAVEYGLIAALIATGLITAMGYLTTGLSTAFTTIKTKLNVTG
jgi:pilus assembly protein Flp/PilA